MDYTPQRVASLQPSSTLTLAAIGKLDRLVDLVGELVIAQAMMQQSAAAVSSQQDERLSHSLATLDRNTRELQQALQRLAVLSDLKANFVAAISHFLRTPLTSIKGYSTLLVSGQMGPLFFDPQGAFFALHQAVKK